MNQLRLPGGTRYVCCNHFKPQGENPTVFVHDLKVARVREVFEQIFAVELSKQAEWVILCGNCKLLQQRGRDMTESAPWHVGVFAHDTVVELRSAS